MRRNWNTCLVGMEHLFAGSKPSGKRSPISLIVATYLLVFAALTNQPLWSQVAIHQDDFEQALKEAAETGRPIFALGIRDT